MFFMFVVYVVPNLSGSRRVSFEHSKKVIRGACIIPSFILTIKILAYD